MKKLFNILLILSLHTSLAFAAELKPIKLDPSYNHDKWETQPKDIIKNFRAYIVSFDSADDNDNNGTSDKWGIPEWVAYEIKRFPSKIGKGPERPNPWITDKELFNQGIAPSDDSYRFSKKYREDHPDEPAYDRGHMCMKIIAYRLGENADWNTHTLLNSCPQRDILNRKIWLDLEKKTAEWADKYGSVWIVCGPIIYDNTVKNWLGEPDEIPVAIPDAFFKIVVKESDIDGQPDVLAFIYPQEPEDGKWPKINKKFDHTPYLVSVNDIEAATGLDFLTILSNDIEEKVESQKADIIWE